MDIEALAKGVGIFSSALSALRQALDILPHDSPQKADVAAALERAEKEFRLAEAKAASELNYEICHNCYPPVIMRSKDEFKWECPECKNIKDTPRRIERSRPFNGML